MRLVKRLKRYSAKHEGFDKPLAGDDKYYHWNSGSDCTADPQFSITLSDYGTDERFSLQLDLTDAKSLIHSLQNFIDSHRKD